MTILSYAPVFNLDIVGSTCLCPPEWGACHCDDYQFQTAYKSLLEVFAGGDDDDEEGYRGSGRITAKVNPGCNDGDCGSCADCIVKYG